MFNGGAVACWVSSLWASGLVPMPLGLGRVSCRFPDISKVESERGVDLARGSTNPKLGPTDGLASQGGAAASRAG